MLEFWNTLTLASQVFYCMAIPATLVLLIQTVLMLIGLSQDTDGDIDTAESFLPDEAIGTDDSAVDGVFGEDVPSETLDPAGFDSLRILTVRGLIAFFVVFGWTGVVMDAAGVALLITLPAAMLAGFATMVILAVLFRLVLRLRTNGNADNRNAIGVSGKVQLKIPPSRTGEGKVHLMLQGAYVERDAVTDETETIPTGSEIVVTAVSGQTTLVVRKK
ncbi:MAG: NfeD family protein [Clostridia bacterium]|nr:NfeD family protein [Clostridia bacterium]